VEDMDGYFRRAEGGFTLIELLIVIAIIGIVASIAIINLIPAERRAKYARAAGDTKTIVTQALVYINDNNCAPGSVADLWDLNGPTGGGACAAAAIPGYMAQVSDPFTAGANYLFGFSVIGVNRSWSRGWNGIDDNVGWDGVAPLGATDDLGNSSQTGCVTGTAAVVPSDIC
jgi:prepilin-type N-terminal cleavage/methylation domain-containing protein